MYDDLLVNGTALSTFGGIVDLAGLRATSPRRGSNPTYPGRGGDVFVDKPRSAFVVTVPLVLLGTSRADYNDRISSLARLLDGGDAVLSLERRMSTVAGNVAHTASGDYLAGLEPAAVNLQTGRVAIDIVNLDGVWYGTSVTTTAMTTAGAHTRVISGDVRTSRVTITFSGGSGFQSVQNTANNDIVSYTGSTSTPVTVDVNAGTATQGGVDVSGNLAMSPGLFRLEAGSQVISLGSTGSAQISYYPAYL